VASGVEDREDCDCDGPALLWPSDLGPEIELPELEPLLLELELLEPLVDVDVEVDVDACAAEASWATSAVTPAPAAPTSPTVASASRRVPSCRVDRFAVMRQFCQPRMKDH
jgi:hypothetical protein